MSVSLKEGVKMKQLKKQWTKVTALLLTFGMVFGLFAAVPVQAEDGNALFVLKRFAGWEINGIFIMLYT